jgi:hypothetical protein
MRTSCPTSRLGAGGLDILRLPPIEIASMMSGTTQLERKQPMAGPSAALLATTGMELDYDSDCDGKRQRKRRLVTQDNRFRLTETPQQAANRLVQEYGLAEPAAEFVHGRLQEHPEGDSRHAHWREVMEIIQKTRGRKMEYRHLLR